MSIARDILEVASQKGAMIALAESCTGGLVAAAITDVPGSSEILDRGFVTYTNAAKVEMLGVSPDTLKTFGAVSEETAREMARGARINSDAQLAVSITGIAGPGGSEFKPEGRVCFAVSTDAGEQTETVEFGALGRLNVRTAARDHALQLLLQTLKKSA